jgi:hypothetical protein
MMAKDAFDRWWEWAEKPTDSQLTIPAHLHDAVMQLAVRLADLAAQRCRLRATAIIKG